MIIRVPMKGKAIDFNPKWADRDSVGVSGDPDDPIRIDVNLGDVSWRLISLDLETGEAEMEVTPAGIVHELKSGGNPDEPRDYVKRSTTANEKLALLAVAQVRANSAPRGRLNVPPGLVKIFKEWKGC